MKTRSLAVKLGERMALLGLAAGLIYSIGGFFVDLLTTGLNWGTAMAFGAVVGMPVIFGVFGFLAGALVRLVFKAIVAG